MSEDWQFCFHLKGLIAPLEGVAFDNMLFLGFPPSDDASVFLKSSIEVNADKDKFKDELMDDLRNIMQIYGLVTVSHVDVLPSLGYGKISVENPFGNKRLCASRLGLIAVYDHEERKKNIPNIEETLSKYNAVKNIFSGTEKAFLRNAVDYFVRSIGDKRLEEKLLDLMISLESLFSNEKDELGLRYSLRASYLLSANQEVERPDIFRNIHSLYNKRSAVVHGTENVELQYKDVASLQEYVREAIKRLIYIDLPKQKILQLLDESVYDDKKKASLNEVVAEAIKKW